MLLRHNDPLDALQSIISSHELYDAWNYFQDVMAAYGFDRLIYGQTQFLSETDFGSRSDFLVLSNIPNDYAKKYVQGNYHEKAPMTQWSRDNVGVKSWSYLRDIPKEELSESALAFNAQFDISAGYTIAFPAFAARNKAAIALISESGVSQESVDERWAEFGETINLINQVFHLKISTMKMPNDQIVLTSRQQQVLEWVAEGKTMDQVAGILELSRVTIEKHLKNSRDSLGVNTTAQAVAKAIFLKQIYQTTNS